MSPRLTQALGLRFCKIKRLSPKITLEVLDEYLKMKLINGLDPNFQQNICFSFYLDERTSRHSTKKKLFREAFHNAYTLNDIIECLDAGSQKQLNLTYRVVLENEIVPAELAKRLPNPNVTSETSLAKLVKKTKAAMAYHSFTNHPSQINEKSSFSAFNYSRVIESSLFLGPIQNLTESRQADLINVDYFNDFENSFKPFHSKGKNTLMFGSPGSKNRQNKEPEEIITLADFNQIGKYLKDDEPIIKRIDPAKIQSLKQKSDVDYPKPTSIKSSQNRAEAISNNFEYVGNLSQSKETKQSFRYDEGLQMLYDKINSLS